MKIVSLITARGGSKGVPLKNIIDINGKPLIWFSINASLIVLILDNNDFNYNRGFYVKNK